MTFELYAPLARQTAAKYGIPENIFLNLINTESGWRTDARSPAGAQGIAQLMPGTAEELGVNPLVPAEAMDGAARYLSRNHKEFGDWGLALAGYNAGPGAVRQAGGIPSYPETQAYVKKILGSGGQPAATGASSATSPATTSAPPSSSGFDVGKLFGTSAPGGEEQSLNRMAAAGIAALAGLPELSNPTRKAASNEFLQAASGSVGGDPFLDALGKMLSGGETPLTAAPVATTESGPITTAFKKGGSLGIVDVGKTLEAAGLRVRENPHFGDGRVGKHSPNSLHYSGQALDVTDWQDPGESERSWKPRKAFLGQQIAQILGPGAEVFHPGNDPQGHGTHIHVGLRKGLGLSPEQLQQITAARQKSLKLYPLRWAG